MRIINTKQICSSSTLQAQTGFIIHPTHQNLWINYSCILNECPVARWIVGSYKKYKCKFVIESEEVGQQAAMQSIIGNELRIARGLSVMRQPLRNEHLSVKTRWRFRRNEDRLAYHTRRNKRNIMWLLRSFYIFCLNFLRLTLLKIHGPWFTEFIFAGEEIQK